MSATVKVPTILRTYTKGAATVSVDVGDQATLAQVLDRLEAAYPGIRARVLDDAGAVRRFVNVYVDDEDVRFAEGLATAVRPGSSVSVIPAVAGGSAGVVRRRTNPSRASRGTGFIVAGTILSARGLLGTFAAAMGASQPAPARRGRNPCRRLCA